MNFIRAFQLSMLIILEMCRVMVGGDEEANCYIQPTNVNKVDVLVYINGETSFDVLWYGRYCAWKEAGMPYDQYAPVTVKVGGHVTCDQNNKCNCPNKNSNNVDCTTTFKHVCLEQILGQEEFKNLLCCSRWLVNKKTSASKALQMCIHKKPGLSNQLSTCMEKQGSGSPQDIALQNSKKVAIKVDLTKNTEPFFFYNGIYDKCISDDSPGWFIQKICAMLKYDVAKNISQCVEAMAW